MSDSKSSDKSPAPGARLGTLIGERFTLVQHLCSGRSGELYAAEHRTLHHRVALRLVHRDLTEGGAASVAALHQDAVASAQLNSPHALPITDFGQTPDGQVYLVTDLLTGETLEQRLARSGPLEEGRALEILRQLEDALSEMHALGMIHGTIRPARIFICQRQGHETCRLMGVGTTRLAAVCESPSAYTSPEGRRHDRIDVRSDLYSLATTAYQMVTCALPAAGNLAGNQASAPTAAPHAAPRISPQFFDALRSALSPQPSARPASVKDFVDAITGPRDEKEPSRAEIDDPERFVQTMPGTSPSGTATQPTATQPTTTRPAAVLDPAALARPVAMLDDDAPRAVEGPPLQETLIDPPRPAQGRQAARPGPAGSDAPLLGRTLEGIYRIDTVVSHGATSTVYLGTNLRLDQPVAIKVLAAYLTEDRALMRRFEAEARLQAKLRHPRIVSVQDFVHVGQIHAIIMEYFEGVTLDRVLYELDRPMPLEQIRAIIPPVLEAIGYAHQQGIIHRDIKPSNILLAHLGAQTFPKLMDFGIAKLLAQGHSHTAPGAMLGTLLYMSPEQCKAQKTVDERSDIYSMGVTLYQMATGMVPFFADSAFEILMAHVQTPPPKPRDLVAELPDPLERLILKALSKDPADRFPSVAAMQSAFAAISLTALEARRDGRPGPSSTGSDAAVVQPGRSSMIARELDRRIATRLSSNTEPLFDEAIFDKEIVALDDLSLSAAVSPDSAPLDVHTTQPAGPPPARAAAPSGADPVTAATDGESVSRSIAAPAAHLKLGVASRGDWRQHFDANALGGGIFCPTREPPPQVGEDVRLEIAFADGPRLFVQGAVTWRSPGGDDTQALPGAGIQVHPAEHSKLSFIHAWARGMADEQRKLLRLPLRLRITYAATEGDRRIGFTRDLHERALFIRARKLLPLNTPIRLLLTPPAPLQPISLVGRVKRLVDGHDDRGMGVELHFPNDTLLQQHTSLINELKQRFLAGELPDAVVT